MRRDAHVPVDLLARSFRVAKSMRVCLALRVSMLTDRCSQRIVDSQVVVLLGTRLRVRTRGASGPPQRSTYRKRYGTREQTLVG